MQPPATPKADLPESAPAFAVERTLGRLGKWLRLLGFDALLETECPPGGFWVCCDRGRTLLTRTRRTAETQAARAPVFIRSNDPFEQLEEVVQALGLTAVDIKPFSRCLRCNEPTEPLPREEARGAVPDYVWETQPAFSRCPCCRRVYWRGTHTARSIERIEAVLSAVR
ncbi:MAG: Mut7-C RNAse domain-containing protein [Desulfobacterales bacterium]|nr:Mut7-C RNAse domain-containing protein [Desulfobacterales bacterium]